MQVSLEPVLQRGRWRLASGLVLFSFVLCHLCAHATLLISTETGETVLGWLMAPWRTLAGTALLLAAALVHYLNALWSIWRRRSLRLPAWEAWQLVLGLCIPFLVMGHVFATRIGEETLGTAPGYDLALTEWWTQAPVYAVLQALAVIVVWTHGCIGIDHWLKMRRWYMDMRRWIAPFAVLLPALALAGFVAAGNHTVREVRRDPGHVQFVRDDARSTPQTRSITSTRSWTALEIALALTVLPFAARVVRAGVQRRRRQAMLTLASGLRIPVTPGASLLEILRDRGIPHASVCGGRARCTTCRVIVTEGLDELPPPAFAEARALARIQALPGTRLACQLRPESDLSVTPLLSAEATPRDGLTRGGLEGSERLVTVVFVDLRGSTRLGESRMPYDVLFVLNHFFREMTEALKASGGHYSQFTGDGLMALYGLEGDPRIAARGALRGAQDMLARVRDLNRRLAAALPYPLRIGIGIHFSEAIVGAMGPPRSQIISAIGDTVNTCARLESLTKDYDCNLVISRQFAEAAGLSLPQDELHEEEVKGRSGKVQFYALHDVPRPD